jgi:voltage-gated potassium channel
MMRESKSARARQPWWTLRLWPLGQSGRVTLSVAPASADEPWRRMRGPLFTLLATMLLGTVGYMLIEGWSVGDAAYMMLITLATIGYGEVRPLTDAGRLFTSFLILVGVAGLSYTFTIVTGTLFEGHLTRQWERRRMARLVDSLTDHYILCGYGRVGQQIARELLREGETIVIIDSDQHELDRAAALGLAVVNGNASEDDTLRAAGIERAKGLIAAVNGDADNTFITISAHALRPEMPIVARVVRDESAPKLRRAGATHVVSPYAIAGYQMATLAARSATISAIDHLEHDEDDLVVVEVRIDHDSALAGLRLAEARRQLGIGLTLLGVRRGKQMFAPPPDDIKLVAGDIFAACGTRQQIRKLENACEGAN